MADRKDVQKTTPERNRNAGSAETGSKRPGQEQGSQGAKQSQHSSDAARQGRNESSPKLPEGSEPAWNPTREPAGDEDRDTRRGGRQEQSQDPNRNREAGTEAKNRPERSGESFEESGSRRRDEDR